jgi:hypothetical protein
MFETLCPDGILGQVSAFASAQGRTIRPDGSFYRPLENNVSQPSTTARRQAAATPRHVRAAGALLPVSGNAPLTQTPMSFGAAPSSTRYEQAGVTWRGGA